MQFALIVDEYGDLEGLVTLTDVLTSIVGDLPSSDSPDEQDVVEREDGSWLVDGLEFDDDLSGEEEHALNTLGGFVMHMLVHIPAVADHFEWENWRFEVVDMDRNRVDKILIAHLASPPQNAAETKS